MGSLATADLLSGEKGRLAEYPLAALLAQVLQRRASGLLTIDALGGKSRLFLRDGALAMAQGFSGFRPLGQLLLQLGWIDATAFDRSLGEAWGGKPQEQALVDMGLLSADQLREAERLQLGFQLRALAELSEGEFQFDGRVNLPEPTGPALSAERTLLEALSSAPGRVLARRHLQGLGGPVRLSTRFETIAAELRLTPEEKAAAALLSAPRLPEPFIAGSGLAPERAEQLLAGLLLLGAAEGCEELPQNFPSNLLEARNLAEQARRARWEQARALALRERERDVARPAAPLPQRPLATVSVTAEISLGPAEEAMAASPAPPVPEISVGWGESPVSPMESVLAEPSPNELLRSYVKETPREDPALRRARMLKQAMGQVGGERARAAAQSQPVSQDAPAAGPAGSSPLSADEKSLAEAIEAKAKVVRAQDLFERLGVPRTANKEQVKAAFFSLAKIYHPDRLSPALSGYLVQVRDLFSAVREAYDTLSDDARRKAYIISLGQSAVSAAATGHEQEAKNEATAGEIALRKKDFTGAEQRFARAYQLAAKAEYLAAQAWAIYLDPARKIELPKVKELLSQVVAKDKACDRAWYYLGVICRVENDLEKAEGYFREAVTANPRHLEAGQELRIIEMRRAKGKKK